MVAGAGLVLIGAQDEAGNSADDARHDAPSLLDGARHRQELGRGSMRSHRLPYRSSKTATTP